ncbi:hypothetical protein HOLleu_15253 [Holothuria leucospilota]|uniref:Uncharacterized protein n=1 Tax=Holothuria leucospilota TaxID=206669 RepID=A0A9Q1C9V1_HOLLE|nr:hypothetical protein HOLleu_15253 [Holothuria leucospilota]
MITPVVAMSRMLGVHSFIKELFHVLSVLASRQKVPAIRCPYETLNQGGETAVIDGIFKPR